MKIAVAMSGGVDSSVAAYLLQQQGHEVVGITLRLWHFNDDKKRPGGCCSIDDIADAKRVCDFLGIPHYVLTLEKEFKDSVVKDFVKEYLHGRTPNPCIVCNEVIKFDLLLKKVLALDISHMATGHYVRVEQDDKGAFLLKKGADAAKDQSYVLYRLTQKELAHLVFPLGGLTKKELRALAQEQRLPVAHKPESQEICFIDKDYESFLRSYVLGFDKKVRPGPIKNLDGKVLGKHKGFPFYTVGQRSGLGLTSARPLYVIKIDVPENTLIVGDKEDVFSKGACIDKITWVAGHAPELPCHAAIKIRRLHHPAQGVLSKSGKNVQAEFGEAQPAVTPGQAAVFYDGDTVLGGGIII